ncbi:serine hydrolase domain-containing protein [Streptomyces olivoreticuli]|uniref:serine hydrolase domain-containing protein n=1 Tax=Streptomyces olivoreticuli TaxID=68246 RepID=UPI0026583DD7|nr:serine hydrolase domain-containing protein [Streptomyces olivoreticuli]WKK26446.1 serine hydrolase domain-containing protein [Streptomyces olivoreticuli]
MPVPFTTDDITRLTEHLNEAVADGETPGGIIICGTPDGDRHTISAGVVAPECADSAPDENTIYDIGSLTKVVATWLLIGKALNSGKLTLDAPIRDALPSMNGEIPSGEATIRQLLSHASGLRASTRLDRYCGANAPLHELLCREPLGDASGTHRDIDRGYILLGLALDHINHQRLDELTTGTWHGMGMTSTVYGPVPRSTRVAPTEQRLAGAPRVWGATQDGNAALLGGIAGHAGVFTTTADLATYAEQLLSAYAQESSEMGEWFRDSLVPQTTIEPGLDRGLSWILASHGQIAYHHGSTGASLYLQPEARRYMVICTNAIYHGPVHTRITRLRALALKTMAAS